MGINTNSLTDKTTEQPAPQKHSLTARILTGLAFSTIGAKLSLLGTVADIGALTDGANLTIGQRIRSVFSKEMVEKFNEKIVANQHKGVWGATYSVMKYTIISGVIGTVAGAVIGWIRGGLIESWKDIFTHPWRSTKIIFGFEKPPEQKQVAASSIASPTDSEIAPRTTDQWANHLKSRAEHGSHAAATMADKAHAAHTQQGIGAA